MTDIQDEPQDGMMILGDLGEMEIAVNADTGEVCVRNESFVVEHHRSAEVVGFKIFDRKTEDLLTKFVVPEQALALALVAMGQHSDSGAESLH